MKSIARSSGWEVVDHKDWSATGRPSVKECFLQVDKCDALLVLSSCRYGWIPSKKQGGDGQRSITWLEVERARAKGIPVFPFLSGSIENCSNLDKELSQFHNDLQENVCGFFDEHTQDFDDKVKNTLEEYDWRKRDGDLRIHRWLRILIPLVLLASLEYSWFFGAPIAWGYIFNAPILTYTSWALTPGGGSVAFIILIVAIYWSSRFDRGKPQLIYRIFPLSFRGAVGMFFCTLFTLLLFLITFSFSGSEDPAFESVLHSFLDGKRNSSEVEGIQEERWSGAKYAADVKVLREYVAPIYSARDSLSRDLTLASARKAVRKLNYSINNKLDSRIHLLVEIGRFQVLALERNAGEAIKHFETFVAPLTRDIDVVWRAEAKYAYASWVDYWAFTNKYPSLNREGSPDYTIEQVLDVFKDAELIKQEVGKWLPWVACAVKDTGANILLQHCGSNSQGLCATLESKLSEAESCYAKRRDGNGLQNIRNSLALRLDAKGKAVEAYKMFRRIYDESGNVDAGLKALALQSLAPVVPSGDGIKHQEIEQSLMLVKDPRRVREIKSCLNLIQRVTNGTLLFKASDCREAYNCFLTDGMLTRNKFCGVPVISEIDDKNVYPVRSKVDVPILPFNFAISGTMQAKNSAEAVITDCEGDVDNVPTVTVSFVKPALVTVRVYSKDDSILLARGKNTAFCNDDSPIAGVVNEKSHNESSAALRLSLKPGSYEFYVGTFKKLDLEFELRFSVEADI